MKPEEAPITPRTFKANVAKLTVDDLPKPKKIVEILSTETLEAAFQKLVDNHILSAPVLDVKTNKYTGFLATRDLVSSVVFIAEQKRTETTRSLKDLFVNAKWVEGGFSVSYLSRRNPFRPVSPGANLLSVCELLTIPGSKGPKRIPVVDATGKVINIISESTIVAFIQKHLLHHGFAHSPIEKLPIGTSPVVCVEASAPAITAFELMDKRQISGLGITKKGKFIGNISGRDLKLFIRSFDMRALATPIEEFLKKLRQELLDEVSPTVTCFPKDNLSFLIEKVVATRLHRIWVVDNETDFKPVRVISLYDILNYCMNSTAPVS